VRSVVGALTVLHVVSVGCFYRLRGSQKMKGLVRHNRGVGQNAFHLVWKPKYAMDPFKFAVVRKHCEVFLREIAREHGMDVFELDVEPDHVHMFVGLPPQMSVSCALNLLKGKSAYKLFRQHPWLRRHFRKGSFWSPGKFFRTVGNVTADVVRAYINDSHHGWYAPRQTTLKHF
jgi:putative transposase